MKNLLSANKKAGGRMRNRRGRGLQRTLITADVFSRKHRLLIHFSGEKFNWPGGPATAGFNWPEMKIYWPGPTDPRLKKALAIKEETIAINRDWV